MPGYLIQGEIELSQGIHYEVNTQVPPLGAGGMGQVFMGERVDEKTGQRKKVAVKFLYQDLPSSAVQRSRREASIQVQNENLIEMMGFICMDDRDHMGNAITRCFVVSELLEGVMLFDLLQGKTTDAKGEPVAYAEELYRMSQEDRIGFAKLIVMKILSGLVALHDKGYIHRDIDPSNIMITKDRKIKLIDFGIAKNLIDGHSASHSQNLTRAGSFIGKPSYAAPELITGDIAAHDVTTDLYQVGILLYELCTGSRPFTGAEHEIMAKQLSTPVPVENVPDPAIAGAIAKATQKTQSERYRSASQFRVDLENSYEQTQVINETPVIQTKAKQTEEATKTVPDSPSSSMEWTIWGGISALALAAGVLLGLFVKL